MSPKDSRGLSHQIFQCANSGVSCIDFLRETTRILLDFSECDAVELRLQRNDTCFRCEATHQSMQPLTVEVARCKQKEQNSLFISSRDESYPSLVVIPIVEEAETIGLVQLKSEKENFFEEEEVESYEDLAQALGLALVSQTAHTALRERVKELTCLYNLAQLAERPGVTLKEILQGVVEMLPPSWQYPEITAARIVLDCASYPTPQFQEGPQKQSADVVVNGELRGRIDVVYVEERPELDEGPFLKEERSLINAVARHVGLVIERRQAAEEKTRLQDQLRHADRLATIGQISAGVAHELNEPLGNILAFAQLAQKQPGLPKQAAQDLEKIVTTSLHAREIIKKLMLFARQMPPQKIRVNLNAVVEEGLYFLESRCSKNGVALERSLLPQLPEIIADPSQLNQVLVNLVVNAIQAMAEGGTLKIATRASKGHVVLSVEDNGVGMSEEVLKRIFTPFFTTKDIHEGTGLGLPVVHGIVNSHGGTITVESTLGEGTRFAIKLPVACAEEDAHPEEDKEPDPRVIGD